MVDLEANFIFHLGSQSKTLFVAKPFSSWEDFFKKTFDIMKEEEEFVC